MIRSKLLILSAVIFIFASCQDKSATIASTNAAVNRNSTNNNPQIPKRSTATIIKESVNDPLALKLKKYLAEEYHNEIDSSAIPEKDRLFQLYEIDLNNDGTKEIFINLISPYFCASDGCTVLFLSSDLKLITKFTATKTPFYALPELSKGYKKLLNESKGEWKELLYDGKKYPSDPTLLKKSKVEPGYEAEIIFDENYLKAKTYTF